jgi:hypothetical protein
MWFIDICLTAIIAWQCRWSSLMPACAVHTTKFDACPHIMLAACLLFSYSKWFLSLLRLPCECQAVATETVEVVETAVKNGNGKLNNSNGGNGSSNSAGNTSTIQVVVPTATTNGSKGSGNSLDTSNGTAAMAAAATAVTAAAVVSTAAVAAAASSDNGASKEASRIRMLNTIDEEQNAEAAGQLELAAATRKERAERSAAGTPYKAPGGSWSKFKTYSVWQVWPC